MFLDSLKLSGSGRHLVSGAVRGVLVPTSFSLPPDRLSPNTHYQQTVPPHPSHHLVILQKEFHSKCWLFAGLLTSILLRTLNRLSASIWMNPLRWFAKSMSCTPIPTTSPKTTSHTGTHARTHTHTSTQNKIIIRVSWLTWFLICIRTHGNPSAHYILTEKNDRWRSSIFVCFSD